MKIPKRKYFCYSLSIVFVVLFSLGFVRSTWSATWEPREIVKKYLKSHYPWSEIEILDLFVETNLPKDPPDKVYLISGPLGKAVFSFGFKSGERAIVQAQIRAMDWVVATRRPLKRGQIIDKDDVYPSLIDVRRMPKEVLTRLEGAWGKVVMQTLEINMPIAENNLGDVPVIKKGQRVTLIISAPGLKITTQGETREDGYPGRQIRVVNLYSNRDVRGIPIDDSNVKVVF
jgi:flagella basal body P-ring formation protein FlgA